VLLDCVIYCAFYSILRGGAVFFRSRCIVIFKTFQGLENLYLKNSSTSEYFRICSSPEWHEVNTKHSD